MKRFHVHAHVDDLARSIAFYTRLFGADPVRVEPDYAKWMLDDPRINFAISTRGERPGVDHLGIQVDTEQELADLKARARAADLALVDEGETSCCYARSDKHWITDPQGIAWEHYHTLGDIPVFGARAQASSGVPEATPATPATSAATDAPAADACCAPRAPRGRPVGIPVAAAAPAATPGSCCG